MMSDFSGFSEANPFFVECDGAYIHGNILVSEKGRSPAILFLHGENADEDRNVFLLLRQTLLDHYSVTSCAFDFIGHGSTSGCLGGESLNSRTQQAANVVDACFDSQPFIVVANGMSAYVALKLTELFPIRGLVLVNPKVYAMEVYDAPLTELKKSRTSSPEHWDKTDAWSIMERFRGCVSIVGANKTDPLCPGTMSRLYSHATRSNSREAFDINCNGQGSELLAYCDQTPKELRRMAELISQICDRTVLNERVVLTS